MIDWNLKRTKIAWNTKASSVKYAKHRSRPDSNSGEALSTRRNSGRYAKTAFH
jgi:hypothetical protein